jgi:hypothetical protein
MMPFKQSSSFFQIYSEFWMNEKRVHQSFGLFGRESEADLLKTSLFLLLSLFYH